MKVPYSVQGVLFIPALIGLIFVMQVICPASVGGECFADTFAVPLFMPAVFMHTLWGGGGIFAQYELLFLLVYWVFVFFLLGLCFDIYHEEDHRN